jgi:hypothetical protein
MFAIVLAATIALHSVEPVNATVKTVTFRGRQALQLVPGAVSGETHVLALLEDAALRDGTIEVDVAGLPRADAPDGARGFIGVAFHVEGKGDRYELIYLRPTNGRANDQLRRNRTTQYAAHPDFPWHQLRKDHPGVYESYVDVEAGAWTKIRIVVAGKTAKLYVNGAAQPCLVVNDLKHGGAGGGIALWSQVTTDAYFSNLKVE